MIAYCNDSLHVELLTGNFTGMTGHGPRTCSWGGRPHLSDRGPGRQQEGRALEEEAARPHQGPERHHRGHPLAADLPRNVCCLSSTRQSRSARWGPDPRSRHRDGRPGVASSVHHAMHPLKLPMLGTSSCAAAKNANRLLSCSLLETRNSCSNDDPNLVRLCPRSKRTMKVVPVCPMQTSRELIHDRLRIIGSSS